MKRSYMQNYNRYDKKGIFSSSQLKLELRYGQAIISGGLCITDSKLDAYNA